MNEKNSCPLLKLNNQCLLKIFQKLNWVDSINLAASCRRLQTVAQMKFKKFGKIERRTLLTPIGCHIVSLSILGSCGTDMIRLIENCRHMKSLKLTNCRIEYDLLSDLVELEELTLNSCYFDDNICWNGLSTLKNLEIIGDSLNLCLNQLLENNVNIEVLRLSGHLVFDCSILSTLKKLHSLRIGFHDEIILDIVYELHKLKKFEMTCWSYKNIGNFIKKLAFRGNVDELVLEKLCCNCDELNFTNFRLLICLTNFRSRISISPEIVGQNNNLPSLIGKLTSAMSHIQELRLTLDSIDVNPEDMILLIERLICLVELNLYECYARRDLFSSNVASILGRIDGVLQQQMWRPTLTLTMPKVLYSYHALQSEMYSINLHRLNIYNPNNKSHWERGRFDRFYRPQ